MSSLVIKSIFLLVFLNHISCLSSIPNEEKDKVIIYLQSFGYLPRTKNMTEITHKQLRQALKRLQINGHIAVTQTITENVLKLINKPRCGVHDDIRNHKRQKRFDLLGDKWHKHHITWRFDHKYGKYYQVEGKVRRVIAEALKVWESHSVLRFQENGGDDADIVISFEKVHHPEVDKFSMRDPILAHAFRPGSGLGGDVHFREDLNWNFDVLPGEQPPGNEKSFFAVALHELGHSLGLGHSDRTDAVMYMYYSSSSVELATDDINGIHHIYGVPKNPALYGTTQNPVVDTDEDASLHVPDKCDTSYDAIALIRNELFIFKGRFMWRPDSNSDEIEIRKMWRELPAGLTHVDSVFEDDDSRIWFFINQDIFVFSGTTFEYRTSLEHIGIFHYPKVDAVFKWHLNQRTYIFSGDQYWRLQGDRVEERYPKDILESWRDVYDIDTAFDYEEKLYFFKGTSFYEFNHRSMRLNRMNPHPTAQTFMKCPGQILFKVATRFGDGEDPDVIDEEVIDVPEDDTDNPEKPSLQHVTPENTSDDASIQQLIFSIMLASLAFSQVLSSISLYL